MTATSCFKDVLGAFEMLRRGQLPVLGLTLAVGNKRCQVSLNRYHKMPKENLYHSSAMVLLEVRQRE